jgi:hypothetical protein
MFGKPEVCDIRVNLSSDDLLGPLGYGDGAGVEPAVLEQIVSESRRCEQVLSGRAIYRCLDVRTFPGRNVIGAGSIVVEDEMLAGSIDGAQSVAVAVCTVGGEIDELIDEHFARGDFLGGMIADIVGSRAVEDVAEKCAACICSEATALNLSASTRLSPGYGTWDVSGQRAVFALLDPSPIRVSLNDHCMMQPKKSISFVMPLIGGGAGHNIERPCQKCTLKKCSYRRK